MKTFLTALTLITATAPGLALTNFVTPYFGPTEYATRTIPASVATFATPDLSTREKSRGWFLKNWVHTNGTPLNFRLTNNLRSIKNGRTTYTVGQSDVGWDYKATNLARLNILRQLMGRIPVSMDLDAAEIAQCQTFGYLAERKPGSIFSWDDNASNCAGSAELLFLFHGDVEGGDNGGHFQVMTTKYSHPDLAHFAIGAAPDPKIQFPNGLGDDADIWQSNPITGDRGNIADDRAERRWPAPNTWLPYYLVSAFWRVLNPDYIFNTTPKIEAWKNGVLVNVSGEAKNTTLWRGTANEFTYASAIFAVNTETASTTIVPYKLYYNGRIVNGERVSAVAFGDPTQPFERLVPDAHYRVRISGCIDKKTGLPWNGTGIDEFDVHIYDPGQSEAGDTSPLKIVTQSCVAQTILRNGPEERNSSDTSAILALTTNSDMSLAWNSTEWFRNGRPLTSGATVKVLTSTTTPHPWVQANLGAQNVMGAKAGIYDAIVGEDQISQPIAVGIILPAGTRTEGAITTRDEWQNIQHKANVYDQFLLTGPEATFTADPNQIARCSFLDLNGSIVQVEMSGAGATTIILDPDTYKGPAPAALYNQAGIQYVQGHATIILAGADETTHMSIYSVGTATNPGVTRADAPYAAWASVAAVGISCDRNFVLPGNRPSGALGGLHMGNVRFTNRFGLAGVYAPTVGSCASLVVIGDITATDNAQPYLLFGLNSNAQIKIAGGSLAQANADSITTNMGLASVTMGAGQDSCGNPAPARTAAGSLTTFEGNPVTGVLRNP